MLADGQTDRQTDRQTQTDFIIWPMLYAIAMGQMTTEERRYRYVTDEKTGGRNGKLGAKNNKLFLGCQRLNDPHGVKPPALKKHGKLWRYAP